MVKAELRMAQSMQLAEREVRVLPILVEDCKIPLSLRDVCWADFRSGYEIGLSQLLRRLVPWDLRRITRLLQRTRKLRFLTAEQQRRCAAGKSH
jgi:hypothetical protein